MMKYILTILMAVCPLVSIAQQERISLLIPPKYITYEPTGQPLQYQHIDIEFTGVSASAYQSVAAELKNTAAEGAPHKLKINCALTRKGHDINTVLAQWNQPIRCPKQVIDQAFIIQWTGNQVAVSSSGQRGLLYGLETVKQLLQSKQFICSMSLADWPDMPQRIFFDDISRGPIPTVESIKRHIQQLAELRYTDISFYIEHVVQTQSYPDFAPEDGKLTISDLKDISAFAKAYQMKVIGSFQCFGHFENILSLPKYSPMGESPSLISPLNKDARAFLKKNIEEICDACTSEYFNINCDETWDIEKGKSANYVRKVGPEKFYADHIRFLYQILKKKGKKTMMWGDIVMKYPETIQTLPADIVYLTWNYDGTDYSPWIQPFKSQKRKFIVCPGVVNSNRILPDLNMTNENMKFIRDGFQEGALGTMLTSWDDTGLHNLSSFFLPVAEAAVIMWNTKTDISTNRFKKAYTLTRFGTANGSYLKTLETLAGLSRIGLTFQMMSRVITDRITPEQGNPMNLNVKDLEKVDSILREACFYFNQIQVNRNVEDVRSLKYAIDSYSFVCDAQHVMLQVNKAYTDSAKDRMKFREGICNALNKIITLKQKLLSNEALYSELWLSENQYYTYRHGIELYESKLKELDRLQTKLSDAIHRIDCDRPLLSPLEAGVDVRVINSNYLGTWLFCGPFHNGSQTIDYLTEMGGEKNARPMPGQSISYGDKQYKWTRYISSNNFLMDPGSFYKSLNYGLAYAYSQLISNEDKNITVLFGGTGENRLIINGDIVFTSKRDNEFTSDKYAIPIRLHKGTNHILIKTSQLVPQWTFSVRLDGIVVKAHKQKYYID